MSWEALLWAREQMPRDGEGRPDPHAKLLLLVICERANAEQKHSCYPGRELLARDTGLAEKTVQDRKKRLVEQGYVEVTPRHISRGERKGQRNSDRYRVRVEKPPDDMTRRVTEPAALRRGRLARAQDAHAASQRRSSRPDGAASDTRQRPKGDDNDRRNEEGS